MLSENYKQLNKKLHKKNKNYGTSGCFHARRIAAIADILDCNDILDYGCGKATLSDYIDGIKNYDPCVDKYADTPKPADIVVCTDVLEHVEPEYIEKVLDHLQDLTKRVIYLTISLIPAKKTLEDGRNAHICLHDVSWWRPKIERRFDIRRFDIIGDNNAVIIEAERKQPRKSTLIGV